MERGIYFEKKPVAGKLGQSRDLYHAYLVFRNGKGEEFVIRGGPEGLSAAAGGAIKVEAGIPLAESQDKYENGDTPATRHSIKLDFGEQDLEKVWAKMVSHAKVIETNKYDYNLINVDDDLNMQNSNSVIRSVLENVEYDVGQIPKENRKKLPGFENDLSRPNKDYFLPRNWWVISPLGWLLHRTMRKKANEKSDEHSSLTGTPYSAARGLIASTDPAAVAAALGQTLQKSYPTAALPDEVWIEDLLAKPPATWTEAERDRAMTHPAYWKPSGAWGQRYAQSLGQAVMGWYEHIYGTGPVRYDATGRMAEARPQHQPAQTETPGPREQERARAKNELAEWLGPLAALASQMHGGGRTGKALADLPPDYVGDSIRLLQEGLNILAPSDRASDKSAKPAAPHANPGAAPGANPGAAPGADPGAAPQKNKTEIAVDGIYGPQTQGALDWALAARGAGAVKSAVARAGLGHLGRAAEQAPPARMQETWDGLVAGLEPDADGDVEPAARSFQRHVNARGAARHGSAWQPIEEDGWLGPQTAAATHRLAREEGGASLFSDWYDNRQAEREAARPQRQAQRRLPKTLI